MEPFSNRLCGRSQRPIHSIFNSIPYTLEQVKNGYDYIIRGEVNDNELKIFTDDFEIRDSDGLKFRFKNFSNVVTASNMESSE